MYDEYKAFIDQDRDLLQTPSSVKSLRSISAESVDIVFAVLRERGWSLMPLAPDHDLRSIIPLLRPEFADDAESIRVERISPKMSSHASQGTMSAIYGMGSFPLHTERAHWRIPPRFLILRSVGDTSDRPTMLLDSHHLTLDQQLAQELLQTPWIVSWGGISFRSRVLRPSPSGEGRWQIRYDRCCMRPCHRACKNLSSRLEQALMAFEPEQHFWNPGIVLLIDNWRVLHGRGKSTESDYGRCIERIVVP